MTASATENQKTEYRNVQVKWDGIFAVWTVTSRRNNGFSLGDAKDTDI